MGWDWLNGFTVGTASASPMYAGRAVQDQPVAAPSVAAPPAVPPQPQSLEQQQQAAVDRLNSEVGATATASDSAPKYLGMPSGYDPNVSGYPRNTVQGGGNRRAEVLYVDGAQQVEWSRLKMQAGQGADTITAMKKQLWQAGYYGDKKPDMSGLITSDDEDALAEAMGDANRSGLPSWQDAVLQKELSGSGGGGMSAKDRQRIRADYATGVSDLRSWAYENGVKLGHDRIVRLAEQVALGKKSLDEVKGKLTDTHVAKLYPSVAEDVKAGYSVRDMASPYMTKAAELLDLPDVGLDDPLVQDALTARNDKGESVSMPLWEFEKKVRNDPRFQYSTAAWDEVSSRVSSLGQMFGFTA